MRRLNIPVHAQTISVGAVNAMNTVSRGVVTIVMKSTNDDYSRSLTCLTLPSITDPIPAEGFPRNLIKIPSNIRLADPNFHLTQPVDLLIGSGVTVALLSIGQLNLSRAGYDLYMQKTRLGWVVVGGSSSQIPAKPEICYITDLESQLNKFWTIEEITPQNSGRETCAKHTLHRPFLVTIPDVA